MKQLKTEKLEILRTFLNNKKNIITNQKEFVNFRVTVLSNMKVMVIEIKPNQSKNTFVKLNHAWKNTS